MIEPIPDNRRSSMNGPAREGQIVHLTRCSNFRHDGIYTKAPRPCCTVVRSVTLGPEGALPS